MMEYYVEQDKKTSEWLVIETPDAINGHEMVVGRVDDRRVAEAIAEIGNRLLRQIRIGVNSVGRAR